ncbi:MAG: GNAT family N-acetyltransferase [Candidatus Woesearchaeota archaeon]
MKIRKAQAKDLKKISEIFLIEYSKKPYFEKWTKTTSLKKIKEYNKTMYTFVAEENKEIMGFLIGDLYFWHDGHRGSVEEFVVSKKYQGQGIGKKLMKHFENFLKKKGMKKLVLMSVTKSNAFKIYKKWGFKEEDFVSMVKKL